MPAALLASGSRTWVLQGGALGSRWPSEEHPVHHTEMQYVSTLSVELLLLHCCSGVCPEQVLSDEGAQGPEDGDPFHAVSVVDMKRKYWIWPRRRLHLSEQWRVLETDAVWSVCLQRVCLQRVCLQRVCLQRVCLQRSDLWKKMSSEETADDSCFTRSLRNDLPSLLLQFQSLFQLLLNYYFFMIEIVTKWKQQHTRYVTHSDVRTWEDRQTKF